MQKLMQMAVRGYVLRTTIQERLENKPKRQISITQDVHCDIDESDTEALLYAAGARRNLCAVCSRAEQQVVESLVQSIDYVESDEDKEAAEVAAEVVLSEAMAQDARLSAKQRQNFEDHCAESEHSTSMRLADRSESEQQRVIRNREECLTSF